MGLHPRLPHPSWVPASLAQSPHCALSTWPSPLLLPPPALAQWAIRPGSRHLSRTPQRGRWSEWVAVWGLKVVSEVIPNDLIDVSNTHRTLKNIHGAGLS